MSSHSAQDAPGTGRFGPPPAALRTSPETELEQTQPIPVLTLWMLTRHAVRAGVRSWFLAGRGTQGIVVVLVLVLAAVLLRSPQQTSSTASDTTAPVTATATPAPLLSERAVTGTPVAAEQDPTAVAPRTPSIQELASLPKAVIGAVIRAAPVDPAPGTTPGTTVLHPTRDVVVYAEPGGGAVAVLPERQILTPTWVPVLDLRPGWALVMLPARPHPGGAAAVGWIHLTPHVELTERGHRIDLDTASGRVSVLAELAHAAPAGSTLGPVAEARDATQTPASVSGHRTFVAIGGDSGIALWLSRLWPLGADTSRVCTEAWTAVSVPGLPATSPLGRLDDVGCVPTPQSLRQVLTKIRAGTVVILR